MMESSSNLHLHHQQEIHGGSSSFTSPSYPLLQGLHAWNHDLILNGGDQFNPNASTILASSSDYRQQTVNDIPFPATHLGFQNQGFHWTGTTESYMNHSSDHDQQNLARIKEEYLSESYPKLTEFIKSDQQRVHELDERLLLDPASFGGAMTNISNMNSIPSSPYQAYMGMDLHALDLLASARFGRGFCEPNLNMEMIGDGIPFGLGRMQGLPQPPNTHHKGPSLLSGVSEAKRGNLEHKAYQGAVKKPRFEARSSCTSTFKVRKEKLGDRIAALQQLVAPFGKTDTASVLMEAYGYIKFLQEQVETLSVPYMKTSSQKLRTTQGGEDGDEEKPDLSSRGLCLVPLSCTSYVTNDNGGIWSPPNYSGTN